MMADKATPDDKKKASKNAEKTAKKSLKSAATKVKKGMDKKLPPWLKQDENGKVVAKGKGK